MEALWLEIVLGVAIALATSVLVSKMGLFGGNQFIVDGKVRCDS
jgi:hypothetical protein